MRGTEEKGVDVRMATDMISLAWADNYDTAVLVSLDRDFVPVAEFLETRGIERLGLKQGRAAGVPRARTHPDRTPGPIACCSRTGAASVSRRAHLFDASLKCQAVERFEGEVHENGNPIVDAAIDIGEHRLPFGAAAFV